MKVGIGYCNKPEPFLSGKKVVEDAITKSGIDKPNFIIAFCNGHVDHNEFFRGLQSVAGKKVPIIGGSAIGIITNEDLSYEGHPAGALVVQSDTIRHRVAVAGNFNKDEKLAGKILADKLSNETEDKLLLIFYDSIKKAALKTAPPVMNASPLLIEGIEEKINSDIPVIGAGLIGDYAFSQTKQFCGSYVDSQNLVGLMLNGDFEPYYKIMHGCTPLDGIFHTITKIKGDVVYEVDGKPIVEIIDNMYRTQDWREQHPLQLLTIGVNYGKRHEMFQESNYVNRLITGILPGGEGVGIFEPGLEEGTEIQFMWRDTEGMLESAKRNSAELMKQIEEYGRKAFFGLYIDCAGRAAKFSTIKTEEASEVQKIFNQYNTPFLGFYSGVEIAPLRGKSRGLDWTGVMLVLAGR
ncbi:MAG: FIST C-terminal domain-containing protein [Spirochaetes bacterium]|nr:FIST C-terminal domain-containing protein [Spirochaetota bacterium]